MLRLILTATIEEEEFLQVTDIFFNKREGTLLKTEVALGIYLTLVQHPSEGPVLEC